MQGKHLKPSTKLRTTVSAFGCVLVATVGFSAAPSPATAASTTSVLILGTTVSGGTSSMEAAEVTAQGLTPVVVDDATWGGMTAAQFASYKAIVIGDPSCSTTPPAAAIGNAATWGSVIDGNVIIIGTDPVLHGKTQLVNQGMDFALSSDAGKVGAYLDLSCDYWSASQTTAAMLDGLRGTGAFQVEEAPNCYNVAHIVATHASLNGLSDEYLSNWGCSVHEIFDTWPGDFQVLAIAKDLGSSYTASDGTVGSPYILATGSGLRSFPLSLSPLHQSVPQGSAATVTAELLDAATSNPVPSEQLSFLVREPSGLFHGSCVPASCTTDTAGHVQFSFSDSQQNTDTVQVFVDRNADGVPSPGEPQTTATVTFTRPVVTCTDVVMVGMIGSGETFKTATDLSVSPRLNAVYTKLKVKMDDAGKSISPLLVDYPATSVNALFNGLSSIPIDTHYVANLRAKVADNLDGYLAGKNQGVEALFSALLDVRSTCQDRSKVVLVGYSQGAMAAHEFLNNFGGPSSIGILETLLIADPDRVANSYPHNYSTAPKSGTGACVTLSLATKCASPYPAKDVRFPGTIQLCTSDDMVCDSSSVLQALKNYAEAYVSCAPSASCRTRWANAIKSELQLAGSIHTTPVYQGTNAAVGILSSAIMSGSPK